MSVAIKVLICSFLFQQTYAQVSANSIIKQNKETYNYNYYDDEDRKTWVDGVPFSNDTRKFPKLEFYDLEHNKNISSEDLFKSKKIVVIEYGNVTCPSFVSKENSMNNLVQKYSKDVDFYVLYIRENHPGKNFPNHKSFDQKIEQAKWLQQLDKIQSKVLVDDINGTAHQTLGNYPNSSFVIGKDGVVAHRGIFNNPGDVELTIKKLIANHRLGSKVAYLQTNNGVKKSDRSSELARYYSIILARSAEFKKDSSDNK